MSAALFPYTTVQEAEPTLTVGSVRLDGETRNHLINRDALTVALFEDARPWKRAELELDLTCDPDRLREFERTVGLVSATAVANCRSTNIRQPVRLRSSDVDVGRWSGVLELDRENIRDRLQLAAQLSATVATVAHRPVAVAPTWSLYADEPESLRIRGTLQVKWVDFETAEAPACDFKKSTHIVSFTGGVPELWLNSSFEGLEPLLRDRKERRGVDRALHDFQRTSIARAAWMALIADAMSAVTASNAEEGTEPEWPDSPWQAEVLKLVLHEVAPGKSERELLALAAEEWASSPGSGEFFARAEAVVGDLVKANESLRRFVLSYNGGE